MNCERNSGVSFSLLLATKVQDHGIQVRFSAFSHFIAVYTVYCNTKWGCGKFAGEVKMELFDPVGSHVAFQRDSEGVGSWPK